MQVEFTIGVVKRIKAPMFNDQDDEDYDPGPPPTGWQIAAFLAVLTAIVLISFWLEDLERRPIELPLEVQPDWGRLS